MKSTVMKLAALFLVVALTHATAFASLSISGATDGMIFDGNTGALDDTTFTFNGPFAIGTGLSGSITGTFTIDQAYLAFGGFFGNLAQDANVSGIGSIVVTDGVDSVTGTVSFPSAGYRGPGLGSGQPFFTTIDTNTIWDSPYTGGSAELTAIASTGAAIMRLTAGTPDSLFDFNALSGTQSTAFTGDIAAATPPPGDDGTPEPTSLLIWGGLLGAMLCGRRGMMKLGQ